MSQDPCNAANTQLSLALRRSGLGSIKAPVQYFFDYPCAWPPIEIFADYCAGNGHLWLIQTRRSSVRQEQPDVASNMQIKTLFFASHCFLGGTNSIPVSVRCASQVEKFSGAEAFTLHLTKIVSKFKEFRTDAPLSLESVINVEIPAPVR
jgi:hypothetical protein